MVVKLTTAVSASFRRQIQLAHLAGNGDPSFLHWNDDMFLSFGILSGCDYLVRCLSRVNPARDLL